MVPIRLIVRPNRVRTYVPIWYGGKPNSDAPRSNHRNLSVAHRDSVAILERIVGEKT